MAGTAAENKREIAAALIAAGSTREETAAQVRTTVRSLWNWSQEPAFQEQVARFRQQAFDQVLGALGVNCKDAVAALKEMLKSKNEPVRLGAAKAMLDYSLRYRDALAADARLAALEAYMAEQRAAAEGGHP